ncbi:hypothetical protein [Staphylococcus phage vB_SauH_DELF3]|nr:hypothetical protein [Staphylococcus phage vB_SauH_DELF3]
MMKKSDLEEVYIVVLIHVNVGFANERVILVGLDVDGKVLEGKSTRGRLLETKHAFCKGTLIRTKDTELFPQLKAVDLATQVDR